MREYALEDLIVLALLVAADLSFGTRLLLRRRFWALLTALNLGTLLFDGYLCARPVLHYADRFLSVPRLGKTPVEDFGYGIAMFMVAVLCWEWLDRAQQRRG